MTTTPRLALTSAALLLIAYLPATPATADDTGPSEPPAPNPPPPPR